MASKTDKALVLLDETDDQGYNKIVVLEESDSRWNEVANKQPNGSVKVQMLYGALNRRDEWIRQGLYPRIKPLSVQGADGVGIVTSDHHLKGKRVLIRPSSGWGDDPRGQTNQFCILGNLPETGLFQSRVCLNPDYIVPCPTHLTDAEAAALPLAGLTAYRAVVTRGQVTAGCRVLVTGIGGGVAMFAAQFAAALGANVHVSSSKQWKIDESVKRLGCVGGVNYTSDDWEKQLLKAAGGPIDVVIDGSGGNGLNKLWRVLQNGARIVTYGATAGLCKNLSLHALFLKNISVLGTSMGTDREFDDMVAFVDRHRLRPVVDSQFDLNDHARAYERLRGDHFGKIVIDLSGQGGAMGVTQRSKL